MNLHGAKVATGMVASVLLAAAVFIASLKLLMFWFPRIGGAIWLFLVLAMAWWYLAEEWSCEY